MVMLKCIYASAKLAAVSMDLATFAHDSQDNAISGKLVILLMIYGLP